MAPGGAGVLPYLGRLSQRRHHHVDFSIPVEIPKSGSAVRSWRLKTGAGVLECLITLIHEDTVRIFVMARLEQLNAIVDVRIRAEQVLPAIVVEIEQAVAPAAQIPAQSGHAARIGGVHERTFPLVAEQRNSFTLQRSHSDIPQTPVLPI